MASMRMGLPRIGAVWQSSAMNRLGLLSAFCLWPAAAGAAEYSSVYTKFDLDTCKVIEKGDEYVYAGTWKCEGYKGMDVVIASSDDRDYAGIGKNAAQTCAFKKTFNRFSTALSPIEWRLKDGKPIAAIERWRVVVDDDGNTVTWLVVNALKENDTCHAHYVAGSYPNANAQARRAADDLAEDFSCENDAPTADSTVGEPGIDLAACRDLPG
jgi:hypothetical protein